MVIGVTWMLSCGHPVAMLEHSKPDDPPRRPRMCPTCQKLRNVTAPEAA